MRFLFYLLWVLIGNYTYASQPNINAQNFQSIHWKHQLSITTVPIYHYQILHTYPHDTDIFTEGLEIADGFLYESGGLYKRSTLRRLDKKTGKVLLTHKVPYHSFAEGITIFRNNIYQLTYETNLVFIYNKHNLTLEKTLKIPMPGWGLTHNDHELIMSNGTSALLFLNPETLLLNHYITVHDKQQIINNLNDLQYVNGKIYANIFQTNLIAIISPKNGTIEGWINLDGLAPNTNKNNPDCLNTGCVLNGIAFNRETGEFLVTGKNWPVMYGIRVCA